MPWRAVVPITELEPGRPVAAEVDGREVVVWCPRGGGPVVMDARCPHQWSHLGHEGVIIGDELVCTAHGWRFAADGAGTKVNINGRRDPKADVTVHPCRVREGVIEIDPGPGVAEAPSTVPERPLNEHLQNSPAEREAGHRTIAAGPARTLVVRTRIASPASVVWDACTEPGHLDKWFQPVTGELRSGGAFELADGVSGTIVQCDPPHLLTFTWVVGDGPVDEVQLRLHDDGDATELEIEHASAVDDADHLAGLGARWEQLVTDALPRHLAGGSGAPPTGP